MKPYRPLYRVIACAVGVLLVLAACQDSTQYAAMDRAEAPAMERGGDGGASSEAPLAALGDGAIAAAAENVERKIVYTATVALRVERFDGVPDSIRQVAGEHDGYIADEELRSRPGRPRGGDWTVRVPVDQYEAFLEAVSDVGDLDSLRQQAEEVTEEYYDVQARLENKRREEDRLLELLAHETATLEDVLNVEQALSSVREEIERHEGRLRVLRDQITFSTVTITVTEMRGYDPEEQTGFFARLSRAWDESLSGLFAAVQWVIVALAAALPWLIVFGAPVIALAVLGRRAWRRARR
ncbi:MAG: DUF4349 domain-containing protein [Candidatus Hydrogenedentota bacterium]